MKTPKFIKILIISCVFFLSFSCKKEEVNPDDYSVIPPTTEENNSVLDYKPDNEGNLIVHNNTSDTLLLYVKAKLKKAIPPDSTEFLIKIQTQGGTSINLKVWRIFDVVDFDKPDENYLFRQWYVNLSQSYSEENRIIWRIEESESNNTGTGEIDFIYDLVGEHEIQNIYSADVYLNGNTYIGSISPGLNNPTFGVNYGFYSISFNYWYSNENDPDGKVFVGWSHEIKTIHFSLNAAYPVETVEVPIYYNSSTGRIGKINIKNETSTIIQVNVNGIPIENCILNDLPSSGLSILAPGQEFNYLIPEDFYIVEILDIVNSFSVIKSRDVDIIELYKFDYKINKNIQYRNIIIENKTERRLTLHNAFNNNYLGFWIEPNTTKELNFNKSINILKAKCWFNTWSSSKNIDISTNNWIIFD